MKSIRNFAFFAAVCAIAIASACATPAARAAMTTDNDVMDIYRTPAMVSEPIDDTTVAVMSTDNDVMDVYRTQGPANALINCLEYEEIVPGVRLGVNGAKVCWQAQRNLKARNTPITEQSVISEMTSLYKVTGALREAEKLSSLLK